MQDRKCIVLFLLVSLWAGFPLTVGAQSDKGEKDQSINLYFENDTLNNSDRHYTNGFKLTWIEQKLTDFKDCSFLPKWSYPVVDKLPFVNAPGTIRDVSLSFGQNIYTPEDISQTELIVDDRPYAGVTYFSAGFHSRVIEQLDSLELYIGLVGPSSYAEEVQTWWHELIGSEVPQGWDNQLGDELILGITYEYKRKLLRYNFLHGLGLDSSMHLGGGLGNAYTYANGGMGIRGGVNLPYDFGTCRIMPVSCNNATFDVESKSFLQRHKMGMYFFASVDVQLVLRDIFLDGNTFKESHSVEKNPLVADFMTGVALFYGRYRMSLANVRRTKQFVTQKSDQGYSSLNFSITY